MIPDIHYMVYQRKRQSRNPAVTSSAFASWIDFPLVRATSPSFSRPGVPVTLGKQKAEPKPCLFIIDDELDCLYKIDYLKKDLQFLLVNICRYRVKA
jgi:hypothetical protein